MELQIVAQSILSEMEQCLKEVQEYYQSLPRAGVYDWTSYDETHCEAAMATWKAAMEIVARQAHITIKWEKGG